jgi:heterotetrameric sarcosine oxidase gamma subunit
MPDAAVASDRFVPIARSPMERMAVAAGARVEIRDGWSVAASYPGDNEPTPAGWADVSHLGKLELQGPPEALQTIVPLELARATRAADAWWCPLTPSRVLVVRDPGAIRAVRGRVADAPVTAVEVTTVLAALTLVGPLAREVFARFCAIDLRPNVTPVGGLRPGSIARQPGVIVREAEDRYLFLFGWAVGEYMWTQVDDAARRLGGRPIGVDTLAPLAEPPAEVAARA